MTEAAISEEEVARIARLARLRLSAEESRAMREQLGSILDYVRELDPIPVEGVDATMHPVDVGSGCRPDEPRPSLTQEDALDQAPANEDGGFSVPKVLDT